MDRTPKLLFICKRNEVYSFVSYSRRSSGLYNSTRFITEALVATGMQATLVEVTDNNDIDREVTQANPDIVIIEALWVVPPKFTILKQLHPHVKWFVHMHSSLPFVALEGIAAAWLYEYARTQGIGIIANSISTYDAFKTLLPDQSPLFYLPNIYPTQPMDPPVKHISQDTIHIGCYGAIRPMKNQFTQALAAIRFAEENGFLLVFHVNGKRVETGGEPVLENIRTLFTQTQGALLSEDPWIDSEDFVKFLSTEISMGMQVSMTETWNVISCDYTAAGLPMVVSKEIPWASRFCRAANLESVEDIVHTMNMVYNNSWLVRLNQCYLAQRSREALARWIEFVESQ
jgi:hypothetical protein